MNREPETAGRPAVRIIRSRRKTAGIQISSPDEIIFRAPLHMPEREISRLLEEKRGWIEKHLGLAALREAEGRAQPRLTEEEIRCLADAAKAAIPIRVRLTAAEIGVRYGRITIRTQRTRWGSCSSAGNLNFNCLLMLCPDDVIDYVVVHELCHRREMNHSPRFWALVASVLPDYRTPRKWLKDHGPAILARI